MIREQKKRIGEKEESFKILKEKNENLLKERNEFEKLLESIEIESKGKFLNIQNSITNKRGENIQNNELFNKLKTLLNFERKKRKMLQQKTYSLQDALRKSENFIITVDSFYTKGLKG